MARRSQSAENRIKELKLELQYAERNDWSGEYKFWMKRGGSIVVVGYLVHDSDCDDPLESCDAMGKIVTEHDDKQFARLVAFNDNDGPDLDEFFRQIARMRGVDNVHDSGTIEVAFNMWEEARRQGKIGDMYSQPLHEKYPAGYRLCKVKAEYTELLEAVWTPDKALLEHIASFPEADRYAEAEKCFHQALDEYNKWAEGECYGVCVDVFRRVGSGYKINLKESEACWGFVGSEYAEESLDETFNNVKENFTNHVKNSCTTTEKGAGSCL